MAEQAAGAVASAVIGGITDRALATVIRKLRSGSRPATAHEKLQRLETLLLKLRCAVEVSEKHAIGSASLLEWRDKLREAAAEAGAVVLDFQRRAREDDGGGEAAATSASASAPAATAGALYFTRSALSGMAQRVRDATRRLFSADEDTKKLDGALEKMELLSPDVTQFLLTLQLEVTPEPELVLRAGKMKPAVDTDEMVRSRKSAVPSPPRCRPRQFRGFVCYEREVTHMVTVWDTDQRPRKAVIAPETVQLTSSADEDREWEAKMLARVLEPTLRRMDAWYIKSRDDRDMGGFEWLAEWAALLQEVVERGNAVHETLCPGWGVIYKPGGDVIQEQACGGALEVEDEDGELYSFARAVQRLALEGPCFDVLVDLCPRKQ